MIPSRDSIIQKVIDNSLWGSWISLHKNDPIINKLNRGDFHWISIKWETIQVRYDSYWSNDTLEIKFNPSNGQIWTMEWIETKNEESDVSWETKIDLDSMDDNISELEEKRQREKDLQNQESIDLKQNEKIKKLQELLGNLEVQIKWLAEQVSQNTWNIEEQNEKIKELQELLGNLEAQINWLAEQITQNTWRIEKLHENETTSPEEPEAEISPENKEKFEFAKEWYRKHWGLENSYQILKIKEILKNQEDFNITNIDWKFDAEFFNAVIEYQESNELKVDWLVWRETFEDMLKEYWDNLLDTKKEAREYYNIEKFEKAEKWYKWKTTESIKKLQEALEVDISSSWFIEWEFNYELMQKIIEFQESSSDDLKGDWLAWYKTLKALWLVNTKAEAKRFYK